MFSPLACNVCPVLDLFFLSATYLTGRALPQKAEDLCEGHLTYFSGGFGASSLAVITQQGEQLKKKKKVK